jgi:hypothetical protein
MVRQTHFKLAACVACWLTSWLHSQICAGQNAAALASAPDTPLKTVVLKDGGVLAGEISRDGDRYLIARAGGEIQVGSANVLFVCDSLEEAYELRREKIERPDAASHLLLADWCLRYNLVSQAAHELKEARELDPLHPRVALLERRLAAASKPRPQSARPAKSTVASAATVTSTSVPSEAATRIEELPDGAVARFTRKVQPILVKNCTTSGCHQPGGSQKFQLDRSLLHGMGNRRTTLQNLSATLALIDRGQPHLSPLLTVPRQTHGGMDRPIFGPRQQSAFTHIVDWVAIVSSAQATDEKGAPRDRAIKLAAYDEATIVSSGETNPSETVTEPTTLEAEDSGAPRSPIRFGAQLQSWKPKDPFDPEIFNRAQRSRVDKTTDVGQHQAMPSHGRE